MNEALGTGMQALAVGGGLITAFALSAGAIGAGAAVAKFALDGVVFTVGSDMKREP